MYSFLQDKWIFLKMTAIYMVKSSILIDANNLYDIVWISFDANILLYLIDSLRYFQ